MHSVVRAEGTLAPSQAQCAGLRPCCIRGSRWIGNTKRSGYSVILRAMSTETDNSPWSRRAESVHSLCGQRERMQSRLGRASCPAEPSVWVVLLTICLLYTSDAADERPSVDLG